MTASPSSPTSSTASAAFDPQRFRTVLGRYPTGVCVVTAVSPEGTPVGMTVGTFSSVSLDPPLVSFMPMTSSSTWPIIREAGRFCVNVLSASQDGLARQFGRRLDDRFEGVAWSLDAHGLPRVEGALAWIDCTMSRVIEAGDHEIALGAVEALEEGADEGPLVFFRGAMGEFRPRSLVLAELDHALHLRLLDRVRQPLEIAAEELGAELMLGGRTGGELVVLATAGAEEASPLALVVGERFPLQAPLGRTIVAFGDDETVARWARDDDGSNRAAVERIRARGYSATGGTPALAAGEIDRAVDDALAVLDRGGELGEDVANATCLTVPIRDGDGEVRYALAGYALDGDGFHLAPLAVVERLTEVAERIGRMIPGNDAPNGVWK